MARKKTDIKNISYDDIKNLYYVTLYYGTDENNKPIKKTVTAKTKPEAKSIIKTFEADKIKEEVVKPKNDTLEQWLDYWLESIVKPINEATTYSGYKAIVRHIKMSNIAKIQLQKLTPKHVQEYFNLKLTIPEEGKDKPLSSNTVKKHYVLLRTSLSVAKEQDIIFKNPMEKVIPPKYIKPKIKFYTIEQLQMLFKLCTGTLLEPAIYLAGLLGLRREEISGLKWSNVNLKNNIITIDEVAARADNDIVRKAPKTETSIRKLTIPDLLHDVLVRVNQRQIIERNELQKDEITDLNINQNIYVVSNHDGEPLNPAHLSSMFAKFIKRNNLPDISLRGLRHSVASIANLSGVTLYDISKMLGHASPDITGKVYVEVFDQHNESAVTSVAKALAQK